MGCENTHRCTLASLAPKAAAGPGHAVSITRAAGPVGGYEVAIGNTGNAPSPAGRVENGVLSSYAKERGLDNCGVSQRVVSDGGSLRLIEQAEMSERRGNPDFIRTRTVRVA